MSDKSLPVPISVLNWSFGLSLLSLVGVVVAGMQGDGGSPAVAFVCVLLAVISGVAFWISLGIVANRLGLSWITWVGLAFITSPIGPVVAFVLIKDRARQFIPSTL